MLHFLGMCDALLLVFELTIVRVVDILKQASMVFV